MRRSTAPDLVELNILFDHCANSSWFHLQSLAALRASREPLSSKLSHCSQWNQGTDGEWDKRTLLKELTFLVGFYNQYFKHS